jgi:hypothetical protein
VTVDLTVYQQSLPSLSTILYTTMEADQTISRIKPDDARRFATDLLVGNGVNENHAKVVASCLVEADLRGVDTHGK